MLDSVPTLDHKRNLLHAHGHIPAGSRLLRTEADKGVSGKVLCVFGIYRSMSQFVECARSLWHPFDELRNLPDTMIKALFSNLTESPHQLTKSRCQFLKKWANRAASLQKAERELHDSMPQQVRRVMEGKRIVVMEELATEMGWLDMRLFSELREGFKLVGTFESTGIFKAGVTLANISAEELGRTPNSCVLLSWED